MFPYPHQHFFSYFFFFNVLSFYFKFPAVFLAPFLSLCYPLNVTMLTDILSSSAAISSTFCPHSFSPLALHFFYLAILLLPTDFILRSLWIDTSSYINSVKSSHLYDIIHDFQPSFSNLTTIEASQRLLSLFRFFSRFINVF